jgi:O-acetylserine/cysteine efflux transporter
MRKLHIAAALTVPLVWGGNFIAAKFGLAHFPPIFLSMLRFAFTALVLLPFVKRPNREQMISIGKISVLNSLHFSLPYIAMSMGLSVASTAITTQLGVPFSCLIGALFLNDRLGPWRMFGMAIAFGGMLIVFGAPEIKSHELAWICCLGAAFFWGTANIAIKSVKTDSMMQMLGWASLFTAPQLLIVSALLEPTSLSLFQDVPLSAELGLAYTVLGSTIVAYGLWNYLLRAHPVSHVAPYSLLTPIIGSALARWFFGESLSMEIFLGGGITIFGVAILVIRRPKLGMLDEPV